MFSTLSLKGGLFAATCSAQEFAEKATEQVTDKFVEAKGTARGAAQKAADKAREKVTDRIAETRSANSRYCLRQIKSALEGEAIQVAQAPDVSIAILKVKMQEELDVQDLLDFRLKGIACRARLEAVGSAAQLAGMVAAGSVEAALGKAEAALPGWGLFRKATETVAAAKGKLATSAAAGEATRSVEFNMYLDVAVQRGGLEVTTHVTIVQEDWAKVQKITSVPKALAYVEEGVRQKLLKAKEEWTRTATKRKVTFFLGEKHGEGLLKGVDGAIATSKAAAAAASPVISEGWKKAKAATKGGS